MPWDSKTRAVVPRVRQKSGDAFFVGLDLGQARDYSAVCVMDRQNPKRREDRPVYRVRHLERYPIGTSYPDVVKRLQDMMEKEPLAGSDPTLLVDGTGVGRAVVDLIWKGLPDVRAYSITIHGGHATTKDGKEYRVPKRELVGVVQVQLQEKLLKISESLPESQTLVQELLNFRAKIGASGHESFGAPDWREGSHDDLVLALSLALWYAVEKAPKPLLFSGGFSVGHRPSVWVELGQKYPAPWDL